MNRSCDPAPLDLTDGLFFLLVISSSAFQIARDELGDRALHEVRRLTFQALSFVRLPGAAPLYLSIPARVLNCTSRRIAAATQPSCA